MPSIKCPKCGCVNFPDAPSCKRCKQSFVQQPNAEDVPKSDVKQQSTESHSEDSSISSLGDQASHKFSSTLRRDGSLLVMAEDDVLPDRCVKCNKPSSQQLQRKLEWAPFYVEGLLGILYYFMRERVTIYIPLCDWHVKRRRFGLVIGTGLLVFGLMLGVVVALWQNYWLGLYGIVSAIAGAFVLIVYAGTVRPKKIQAPYVWLKGVHKEFLDSLPVD